MRPGDHGTAPVPPANRPGHHPEVEQDKPDVGQRFPFEFDAKLGLLARLVGVHPGNARVHLTRSTLLIRFGRWSLETPVANIVKAEPTGPYAWWKVAGPPRLSLADRVAVLDDGVIAHQHTVDLPRPRARHHPGFAELRTRLLAALGVDG